MGHDMAPMTGGIANGQQDGPVLGAGKVEGFLAPRVPVNRIVLVLQEIGAGFLRQEIAFHGESGR